MQVLGFLSVDRGMGHDPGVTDGRLGTIVKIIIKNDKISVK